jgi:signal transduction histidine kinase
VGAAVALTALICGWPYWRANYIAAAVTLLGCAGFAVVGGLLTGGRLVQRTGSLFLCASVAWTITWSASWNVGVTPLISVFAQSCFFLALGVGVLLYPTGRLDRLAERLWTCAAALILFGGQFALCVTSEPRWNGFGSSVVWPTLLADRTVFNGVLRTQTAMLVALGGSLVTVLAFRLPRTGRLERTLTIPVTTAVAVVAVTAVASQGSISDINVELTDVLRVYAIQGTFALTIPLAFLATGLRKRLAELTVAEWMSRLTAPVSIGKVRDALRGVLHDDTLDLWFWVPEEKTYVDVSGHWVDAPRQPDAATGRWRLEVRTEGGDPLATVEVTAALRDHASLVEAALAAGGRALETAQLQATAHAHLEQARAAQERLVRVQTAERERLAGDLQRSAEQRLHSLEAILRGLELMATESSTQEQVRSCRRELAEAVAELRDLARGVHPGILTNAGLGPAMDLVAGRTVAPVRLEIPARRFPPEIESTLYFALCEALTNAVKHAHATDIRLSVRTAPGRIVAEVRDDGVGEAHPMPDRGGLTGMIDRIGALRGDVEIDTASGAGTVLRISVPYE